MSKATNRAKAKWNAANYTQVKVSADPATAADFKAACAKAGRSMADVLSEFMAHYSGSAKERRPSPADDMSTRRKRRRLLISFARWMEKLRDAEEDYLSNIPENLRGSVRYDNAEHSVNVMDEVIGLLGDIY